MLKITYRRLAASDLKLLQEMNLIFAEAFNDSKTHLTKKPSAAYLKKLLTQKHFIALAALCKGQVVGGLVAYCLDKYEQNRSEIYLYDLAVALPYRRRGIGRTLIQRLKPVARKLGAFVIFVQADPEDKPALQLYRSMGRFERPFHFDISVK